jgi:nucleoside-diphosphate-sugar epimerase
MIRQNRFLLPARGKGIFSPIYVEDLVEGLLLASKHPRGAGQVFTLTGGESVTCQEFFSHYYRMLHKSGPKCVPTAVALPISQLISLGARLARVPTEINATSTRYLTRTGGYSIDKARSLLNYHPKINLSEGMERTEVWLAANGMLS